MLHRLLKFLVNLDVDVGILGACRARPNFPTPATREDRA